MAITKQGGGAQTWGCRVHKRDEARKAHGVHAVDFPESQQEEFLHNLENTGELQKMIGQKYRWITGREQNGLEQGEWAVGKKN